MPDAAEHLSAAVGIVRRVETNRIGMLLAHGIYKVLVGVAILLANRAAFNSLAFRYLNMHYLSLLAMAGGSLVLVGVLAQRWRLQLGGLLLILVFDGSVAIGLGASFLNWPRSAAVGPTIYPVLVYMHLATIMAIHSISILSWRSYVRREHAEWGVPDA